MIIREAELRDADELVDMYYDVVGSVYPMRKQMERIFYYQNVIGWFKNDFDIFVTERDGEITGFLMGYIDSYNGIVEPYYKADISYVKEKYRFGRSAYLLYNKILETYKGYNIEVTATTYNEGAQLVKKFGDTTFITYERVKQC